MRKTKAERAKINATRDYKKEARQNSTPAKRAYRAELGRMATKMGYGNGNTPKGKDLIHKGGKIVGLGDSSANRAEGGKLATMARMKARRKKNKNK